MEKKRLDIVVLIHLLNPLTGNYHLTHLKEISKEKIEKKQQFDTIYGSF